MRCYVRARAALGLFNVLGLAIGIALVTIPFSATHAAAQDGDSCSECKSCSQCSPGTWGGNSCSFSGGCCKETGGNCNPEQPELVARGVSPADLVTANHPDQADHVLLARVSHSVLAEWDCFGEVRALYFSEDAGDQLGAPASVMKSRYDLAGYLDLARQRLPALLSGI